MNVFKFFHITVFVTLVGSNSMVFGMDDGEENLYGDAEMEDLRAHINDKDENYWTPLYRAILASKPEAVKLCIELGADVHSKNGAAWLPLHGAATRDNEEIVKILLGAGAEINAKTGDSSGCTPLHIAVQYNQQDIVRLLVSRGASINSKDIIGRTPLHYALYYANANISSEESDKRVQDMVTLLINLGADASIQDNDKKLPDAYAKSGSSIAQFLAIVVAQKKLEKLERTIFY